METAYPRLRLEAAARDEHGSMWAAALRYHRGQGTERNLSRHEKSWPHYRDSDDSLMKKPIHEDMKACADERSIPVSAGQAAAGGRPAQHTSTKASVNRPPDSGEGP